MPTGRLLVGYAPRPDRCVVGVVRAASPERLGRPVRRPTTERRLLGGRSASRRRGGGSIRPGLAGCDPAVLPGGCDPAILPGGRRA
ncbi:hypothetical protein HCA58_19170 [Micromonospora sp. HNM0581]|uniref:hypothetical protein n=1 Tax=Micromonospora sp. HNM0581 TaxID=2716341 RepID=UPI00146D8633|nr:hypothetical protein [Micromonospora sp. HNM0581]NLU80448.1 hypothetical protein [Micromonospora sp. HNM0581]